jgi:hypothetical protein
MGDPKTAHALMTNARFGFGLEYITDIDATNRFSPTFSVS